MDKHSCDNCKHNNMRDPSSSKCMKCYMQSRFEAITNADLIRAMSNEGLAKIIMCPYDKGDNKDCEKTCTQCCHDWLSQPAEED